MPSRLGGRVRIVMTSTTGVEVVAARESRWRDHRKRGGEFFRCQPAPGPIRQAAESEHGEGAKVANPCLAKGTTRRVEIEDERLGQKWNVTMAGEDIGSFEACNKVVELVMAKDS